MSAIGNFAQSFVKDTLKTALGIVSSNLRAGTAGELARSNGIFASNINDVSTLLGCTTDNSVALTNRMVVHVTNTTYKSPANEVKMASQFSSAQKPTAPGSIIKTSADTVEYLDLTFGGGDH